LSIQSSDLRGNQLKKFAFRRETPVIEKKIEHHLLALLSGKMHNDRRKTIDWDDRTGRKV
jgi:hypothetical protein